MVFAVRCVERLPHGRFDKAGHGPARWFRHQSKRLLAAGWLIALPLLWLAPPAALAQVPVVGWLWMGSPPLPEDPPFLREELKRLGHQEGRTYVLESRYAEGDSSRFPALARELLDRRPAVIVTTCGSSLRAIRALNATVPVIVGCADPKNFLGEVATLNRPGGRTTGFTFLAPESAAKRLQLLKELQPKLSRVAVLHDRDDWGTYWQEMERAAPQLHLTLTRLTIDRAEELDSAFAAAVRQRAEALVVMPAPTMVGARKQLAMLAIQHKLPTVFDLRYFVEDGGLLSYGPIWGDDAPRVYATYVDKILNGADPGDLPVQQPTRLELVINLKTARAIGLNVPKAFLNRADEVIK
jgi:putative tryptophan/tyrosine transport system substrate-binding protein